MDLTAAATHQRSAREVLDDWTRALILTVKISEHPQRLLIDVIRDVAATRGDEPALLSDHDRLSFKALFARSNQYGRWALALGLQKGDVICLMMSNRPDYVAFWLGVTAVGGTVALVNEQLKGDALAHCIGIVGTKWVVAAAEFQNDLTDIQNAGALTFDIWLQDAPSHPRSMDIALDACSGEPLSARERRGVTLSDRALCIYTSGTTGFPKAANVSHRRVLTWSYWFAGMMNVGSDDRMYDCLPMHHSIGGIVAVGSMLVSGASTVLREKFSVREFWDDVVRWNCTLFQYIGELCRYLVNAPPSANETNHRLRLCSGNGLRGGVWTRFQERFGIPQILEFYAASEGSFSLFNLEGKPGAIGRVPGFLAHRFPAEIIRTDIDTEAPVLDEAGFCIPCATNEVGEAIGEISNAHDGVSGRFEGYSSAADSERKILRNVFVMGDAWFRTGDLMRKDEKNFFYFVDRMGETFRWKGENVSTSQVSDILGQCRGVVEATVYGVAIPETDGRAGMAALVVNDDFALDSFWGEMNALLPGYARPIFLRLRQSFTMTATFKLQKQEIKREGFDPSIVRDPLYVQDARQARYRILDQADFIMIQQGRHLL
jgi:fatty-acyl-CoA synthase